MIFNAIFPKLKQSSVLIRKLYDAGKLFNDSVFILLNKSAHFLPDIF